MEREKPNFDILGRIDRERLARGWIEKICHGLGITLSQFFEEDAAIHHLTEEQKSLLTTWDRLSPSQRTAILDLIQAFLPE